MGTVLSVFGGQVVKSAADLSTGVVKTNADKGIFPLKIREPMILEANNFLRKKGLFPEDSDDDDEMVFGDDDFPSVEKEEAAAEEEEEAAGDIDDPFAMMGGMGEETVYKVTLMEEASAESAPAPKAEGEKAAY